MEDTENRSNKGLKKEQIMRIYYWSGVEVTTHDIRQRDDSSWDSTFTCHIIDWSILFFMTPILSLNRSDIYISFYLVRGQTTLIFQSKNASIEREEQDGIFYTTTFHQFQLHMKKQMF